MTVYQVEYTPLFEKNLNRYRSMRRQIRRQVGSVLQDPYAGTERLGKVPGRKDLRGCRSIRVTRNFRIIRNQVFSEKPGFSPHRRSPRAGLRRPRGTDRVRSVK